MELATLLFLGNLGGTEIFVIVFVILLFFGAKKLRNWLVDLEKVSVSLKMLQKT